MKLSILFSLSLLAAASAHAAPEEIVCDAFSGKNRWGGKVIKVILFTEFDTRIPIDTVVHVLSHFDSSTGFADRFMGYGDAHSYAGMVLKDYDDDYNLSRCGYTNPALSSQRGVLRISGSLLDGSGMGGTISGEYFEEEVRFGNCEAKPDFRDCR